MKIKNTVSVMLATVMMVPFVLGIVGCAKQADDEKVAGKTVFGNNTYTETVKDPSDDIVIKLIRGKKILKEGTGTLNYNETLKVGDVIEVQSDYRYFNVNLFDKLGEQLVYSPSGQFTYQIPSLQSAYESGTFSGTSHTFTATKATDAEVAAKSNVALNAYDAMFVDEVNDQTVEDNALDEELTGSAALNQVKTYPHAYANRVTRNDVTFFARNAIDGGISAAGHGNYPYQSWGYDQKTDAEFTVYFGRAVTVEEVGFVLRADYSLSSGKEHDTYWDSVTLQFSDGSTQEITNFTKSGDLQLFELDKTVTTSFVRIKNIREVQNVQGSQMFAALTEFEVYGREQTDTNLLAERTAITPTFGGSANKFSTSDYRYADIKAIMDKSIDWFIEKTETTSFQIPNANGSMMQVKLDSTDWKDAVYYSGLNEAFFTTGDMEEYYFLRGMGNEFEYKIRNGHLTPHSDNYQIGETYLQLNDITGSSYKIKSVIANADYNLARDVNDPTPPVVTGGENIDKTRDWSHLGWWWCDALYMAMNTYTLLSIQTGDSKYVEAAYEAYRYWKDKLYNETFHLWHRDQKQFEDYTTLTDENGNKIATFWSRGNAWVFAALGKQLMYLDRTDYPELYAEYEQDYLDMAEALAGYQRVDGTWNASIIDENYYGGTETTGTLGFIYSYCIGLRLGLLNREYYDVVRTAWDGVVDKCIFEDGQVGYMQTTGYQPANYVDENTSKYYTHEFGMGLFLLACSGMMSICSDYTAPAFVIPADPQTAMVESVTKK